MKSDFHALWKMERNIKVTVPRLLAILLCLLFLWAIMHWLPALWQDKGLEGDDKILAKVNGRTISQYDLTMELSLAVGDLNLGGIDARSQKEMLTSLVQRGAIARAREKEMSRMEATVLEKQVESYRSKLLVRQYLAKHAENVKLTDEEIKKYYEDHLNQFGGRSIKTYEMLAGMTVPDARKRNELIKLLTDAGRMQDWRKSAADLFMKGYGIRYLSGSADEKMLQPEIGNLLASLQKGQTSSLTFIEGKPYLVRVSDMRMTSAKPLEEVKEDIRKILMPKLYKQAVMQVSDKVMKKAGVKYY